MARLDPARHETLASSTSGRFVIVKEIPRFWQKDDSPRFRSVTVWDHVRERPVCSVTQSRKTVRSKWPEAEIRGSIEFGGPRTEALALIAEVVALIASFEFVAPPTQGGKEP